MPRSTGFSTWTSCPCDESVDDTGAYPYIQTSVSIKAHVATELTALQQSDLLTFLRSTDGTTEHLRSEGDELRDALRLQGTCPAP
jgi:hypothetical protein